MSLEDILVLYGALGIACAIAVFRRSPTGGVRAVLSALFTIPLWPLWAPFALTSAREAATVGAPRPEVTAVQRAEAALSDAVLAVAGTPMSDVFSRQVAARIANEVRRIASRHEELVLLSERIGLDAEASARHLDELERTSAPERSVATARLQHESLTKLEKLHAGDGQAREELADLLEGSADPAGARPLRGLPGRRSIGHRLRGVGPTRRVRRRIRFERTHIGVAFQK